MVLIVAELVADRQVFRMAVAAFAPWLDVFQRCGGGQHMLAADPAGHNTMQLARHCLVDLVAGVGEFAHEGMVACLGRFACCWTIVDAQLSCVDRLFQTGTGSSNSATDCGHSVLPFTRLT